MSKINPFKNSSFHEERPRDERPRREPERSRREPERPRREPERPRREPERPRREKDDMSGKYFSFSEKPKEPKFSLDTELFPELASLNLNKEQKDEGTSISFLNALNTIKEEKEDTNKINPGWITMSFDKQRNINIQYADEKTPNEIKREQIEKDLEDLNLIMEKVIDFISERHVKHIKEYDSIHGEGAYNEVYYMKPIEFPYDDENDNGEIGDEENYNEIYDDYDDYYNE
jgi:hypothetical protein